MTGSMSGQDMGLILGTIIGGLSALGAFVWTIFRIARGVAAINAAVNHAEPGESTLRQEVIEIKRRVEAIEQRFDDHDAMAQALKERVVLSELDSKTRHAELVGAIGKVERQVARVGARTTKVEQTQRQGRR